MHRGMGRWRHGAFDCSRSWRRPGIDRFCAHVRLYKAPANTVVTSHTLRVRLFSFWISWNERGMKSIKQPPGVGGKKRKKKSGKRRGRGKTKRRGVGARDFRSLLSPSLLLPSSAFAPCATTLDARGVPQQRRRSVKKLSACGLATIGLRAYGPPA